MSAVVGKGPAVVVVLDAAECLGLARWTEAIRQAAAKEALHVQLVAPEVVEDALLAIEAAALGVHRAGGVVAPREVVVERPVIADEPAKDAAFRLDVSAQQIGRWCHEGVLVGRKSAGRWFVNADSVNALVLVRRLGR